MKRFVLCLFAAAVIPALSAASSAFHAAAIFSDNMVLQQKKPVPVWGWTPGPGEHVTVEFRGQKYISCSDDSGRWIVYLSPSDAGGPFDMKAVCGSDTLEFSNILVGEVWLASGQSNMNFRLSSDRNAGQEMESADLPEVREFCTPDVVSRTPLCDFSSGEWKICSPETAGSFSAVAYYFARSLNIDRDVPVGIIHSSWSGTRCESWISAEMLYTLPEFRQRISDEIYESEEDWQETHMRAVEKNRAREEIFRSDGPGVAMKVHFPEYDDMSWKQGFYPIYPSRVGFGGYRIVWFRKEVQLDGRDCRNDLILDLGKVMTGDVTYFNGVRVGSQRWDGFRSYRIPSSLLRKGRNVIAVRLLSEWGNGRLGDEASCPHLYSEDGGTDITLKGEWKYNGNIEPELPVGKGCSNNLSAMFNAKISPLFPFALRGILWYQGEGNSGQPDLYGKLQPLLINDWRIRFMQGNLPFLFVQLPNYSGGKWADFREVQTETLSLPETGMAVTIDVGNPYDIHPDNKKPVGERLYLRAKELVYGDSDGVFRGPSAIVCQREGAAVRVIFDSTGSGLVCSDGKPPRTFELAGSDGCFYRADAETDGSSVVLKAKEVPDPVSVRYAWSSNPDVNLSNSEGLPVSPFMMNVSNR